MARRDRLSVGSGNSSHLNKPGGSASRRFCWGRASRERVFERSELSQSFRASYSALSSRQLDAHASHDLVTEPRDYYGTFAAGVIKRQLADLQPLLSLREP